MKTFHQLFWPGMIAGVLAGLVLSMVQEISVIPLIHKAETLLGEVAEEGLTRQINTYVLNSILGIGYGLILSVALALYRNKSISSLINWKTGLAWGFAGYVVFQLAPAAGLLPQIPGANSADLEYRTLWWIMCVILTALGLGLGLLSKMIPLRALGIFVFFLPHIIGAPQPESSGGIAPQEMADSFVTASLISSLVFWIILGILTAELSKYITKGSRIINS
ncbi:CbtA family protein [Deltaproteobacteria bacterium]|nr:CbtA family protein [Deltaproteobacteria bacterium]